MLRAAANIYYQIASAMWNLYVIRNIHMGPFLVKLIMKLFKTVIKIESKSHFLNENAPKLQLIM